MPTPSGDVWFKENPPALAFEPALTVLVAERRPDCSPEVIAAEGPRLLTRHVGPSLREVHAAGGAAPSWQEILPGYGRLQIDLAQDVEAALAAGTPDLRPERLRAHAERFLRPDELDAVSRAVDGLGAAVPPMLAHEEVHDGNVFVRDGRPFFLDWAEACVSHPFVGTVLMLRAATEHNGFEPGSPEVERLRDLYLEPFTGFAALPELREAYGHAYLLGAICRMVTWDLIVAPYKQAAAADVGDVVGAWLGIYREVAAGATMLGGA